MSAYITEITNAFEPHKDKIKHEISAGISIKQWLEKRFPNFVEFDQPTICTVNGSALLRKNWNYEIQENDVVNFVKVAPGTDPVTIALVVISVASVAYSIDAAKNLPDPNAGRMPPSDPSYALRGQSNDTKLMEPVEVAYGQVRMWPSYGARSYNEFQSNEQYLYSLFCLGQGAFDVKKIQIEDTEIDSFQDIETQLVAPNNPITLFPDNVVTSVEISDVELVGMKIPEGNVLGIETVHGPYTINPSGSVCNKIELDFVFPNGIYFSKNGKTFQNSAQIMVQWRQVDEKGQALEGWDFDWGGPWLIIDGSWEKVGDSLRRDKTFYFNKIAKNTNIIRETLSIDVLPARYEIRVWQVDTLFKHPLARNPKTILQAARAFLESKKEFGNLTMLAFKARASNNLNDNSSSRVNVYATRKLTTWHPETGWSEPVATRSIVWAFCDVFRAAYGGKLTDKHLDLETLYKMDLEYEARGEYFDFVFDQPETCWEAATTIARCGRAIPILNGSQITMIRDEAKSFPVAVFNQNNIIKDSLTWDIQLFEDQEHDSVEMEYTDTNTWNPEEVVCVVSGDGVNPEKIKLAGCTDRDHAYREGLYIAANKLYIRETISFQTGLEGHIPSYGDLISVSHDLPRWGQAGFVERIDDKRVTLSDAVEFGDDNHYIVFRKKDGSAAGPYLVTETNSNNIVELEHPIHDEFYFDDIHEPPLYQFGLADKWAKHCRVVEINPSDNEVIDIVCTNYDSRPHTFDHLTAPPVTTQGALPKIPDLPTVAGLTASFESDNYLRIKWQPALGAKHYILQESIDNETWEEVETLKRTNYLLHTTASKLYLRVAAVNIGGGEWDYYQVNRI